MPIYRSDYPSFEPRKAIPALVSFALILISSVIGVVPNFTILMPFWSIMFIYFWSIYAPLLLPSWWIFLLGLCEDVLSGRPFGSSALLFLLLHLMVLTQRRQLSREPFTTVWICFVIAALFFYLACWGLLYSIQGTSLPFYAMVNPMFITALVYPVVHYALTFLLAFIIREPEID